MKTRKVFIFVFTIVLAVCMSVPINADIISSGKMLKTIDAELQTIFQDAASNERIPVDIWLYETSSRQEREQKIYSKIGVNKAQIVSDAKISAEKVDEYIATERALYAAERSEQYAMLKLEYSDIEGLQETRKADTRLFYSQYAPMVSAELTSAEIKLLARDTRVESICYSPDMPLEPTGDISVPLISANYTRDTLGYTGNGVRIGLLEARGLPDVEGLDYFDGADIRYDPDVEIFDDHATDVAAIIIAQQHTVDGVTYEGIVPDATLFATCYDGESDWRVKVEWLISKTVHVINMSAGNDSGASNTYDTREKWLDHVAVEHHVHFVHSAGNTNGKIIRPGMAYNILTVGAINDMNTLDPDDDDRYHIEDYGSSYGSSYIEQYTTNEEGERVYPTNKPDLVAPGVDIDSAAYLDGSDYVNHGTSLAAPHVTGVIAQLCQRQPSLRTMQAGVKAILTASISHRQIAYDTQDYDNYDKFGAGVVNAKEAFETANAYRMTNGSFSDDDGIDAEQVYTFSVPSNQRVRVSLTWLKHSVVSGAHTNLGTTVASLADLDLYIIDPDGLWINYSSDYYFNTEIVDFTTEKSGTYKMVVINHTPPQVDVDGELYQIAVNFALAWWFE